MATYSVFNTGAPYGTSETAWKNNNPNVSPDVEVNVQLTDTTPSSMQEQQKNTTPDVTQNGQQEGTTPDTQNGQQEVTTPSTPAVQTTPNAMPQAAAVAKEPETLEKPADLDGQNKSLVSQTSPWDAGFEEALRQHPDITISDAVRGYNVYAKEKGKDPLDILDMWPLMQNYDITKSLEQNEKDEKKRANKEKFDQISNVLSHFGNFIGTLAGAPSQDIESGIELTKRQQMLRDKTLEQRRQANNDYIRIYQAQQAQKRAAELNEANIAYKRSQAEAATRRLDIQEFRARTDKEFKDATIEIKRQLLDIQRDLADGKITLMQAQEKANLLRAGAAVQNANTNAAKANYTTTKRNADGSVEVIEHNVGSGGSKPGGRQIGWNQ